MADKATVLISRYLEAKQQEDAAKELRQKIGKELADLLGYPEEGSKTHTIDNYKVTIKGVINRKVDWDAFDEIEFPHAPPVKTSRSIDAEGVEWYREFGPDTYEQVVKTITSKPGATQVTIKEKGK